MKRNQFFLEAIRLLTKAVFFYVLGAFVAKYYVNNESLLIDVDNAVVGMSNSDDDNYKYCNNVITIDKVIKYTQNYSYSAVMNTNFIVLNWKTSVERVQDRNGLVMSTQKYDNFLLDKPPRGDWIKYNTS